MMPVTLSGQVRIGGRALFPPVRLTLAPGKWTALLGPSGVGKSTLLRLIAGLPIGGDFIGSVENRPAVALMAQDPGLLGWLDVRQNAALGARLRGETPDRDRLETILAHTGLADHAAKRPAALSGGQRQRVALARALVGAPRILTLDEPLGALDALTRIEMQGLLERIWREKGFTAVLVTHDVAEAVILADRVVVLEEGQITLDLVIDLPRPRSHGSPEVAALEQQILHQLFGTAQG